MLGIKGFPQLSLSRPSSQTPAQRSSPATHQSPVESPLPEPARRPTCNEDYYLSDDQLVLSKHSNHLNGLKPVPPANVAKLSQSSTPHLDVSPASNTPTSKAASKPNQLAVPTKSQASTSATPTTTVISGQPTPTSQQVTHKKLISNLRTVSTKQFATITRNVTPLNSRPGSPPSLVTNNLPPAHTQPIALHQLEASYVSKVGVRLQGLIDQVFPSSVENGPAWMGRGAPKPSCVVEVGKALQHELEVSSCDSYIFRSLLRTAAIPALTVFAGRLHSLLILSANEPSVLYVPRSAKDTDHSLPVALRYNIEVIRCAWSAYTSVGNILKENSWSPEIRKVLRDGLAPFLSKMDAVVQQFMGPYLLEIKKQVTTCILKCQITESSIPTSPPKGHHPLGRSIPSLGGYGGWITPTHPPDPLRELTNFLEGTRKLLMAKVACGAETHRWMVSVATHVVWKGMLVFATSAFPLPTSPTNRGLQQSRITQTAPVTHFIDSYSSAFGLKGAKNILHPGKRSPSPPLKSDIALHHALLFNLKVFASAVNDFVKDIAGLDQDSRKVVVVCTNECELCTHGFLINSGGDGDLVEEAMKEALEALSALQLVTLALLQPSRLRGSLVKCAQTLGLDSSSANLQEANETQFECPTLTRALQELPPFILLHLIVSRISKESGFRLPHEIWGDGWMAYQEELKGFMVAERWLPEVAHEMAREVRRIRRIEQTKVQAAKNETNEANKSLSDTAPIGRAMHDMEWMNLLMLSIQIFVAS